MYTGERTLSSVAHFLSWYLFAHTVLQVPPPSLLPPDFHDWVAYRLHFRESTMGYRNMILERFPDESLALDRFFELADAHRNRQEKVVARVQRHDSSRETSKIESGTGDGQSRASMTEEVKIVVYTDDPGFFLVQDNQAVEDTERGQFCLRCHGWGVLSDLTRDTRQFWTAEHTTVCCRKQQHSQNRLAMKRSLGSVDRARIGCKA